MKSYKDGMETSARHLKVIFKMKKPLRGKLIVK